MSDTKKTPEYLANVVARVAVTPEDVALFDNIVATLASEPDNVFFLFAGAFDRSRFSINTYPNIGYLLIKNTPQLIETNQANVCLEEPLVIDTPKETIIGIVHFEPVFFAQHADMSCAILPAFRNKGYGKLGVLCALDELFSTYYIRRVAVGIAKKNTPSIELARSLGAVHEGELRDHYLCPDGSYDNRVLFSLFKTEFEKLWKYAIKDFGVVRLPRGVFHV